MNRKLRLLIVLVAACAGSVFFANRARCAGSRKLKAGEPMPEFSAVNVAGESVSYKHGAERVLVLAFLSAGQERSQRAAADLLEALSKLGAESRQVDLVAVVHDPNAAAYVARDSKEPGPRVRVALDKEHKLWGTCGIIVTPTVVISDRADKIARIEAGYAYDFAAAIRAGLNAALGLGDPNAGDDVGKVTTVANATAAARVQRHMQMAKLLMSKGRFDAAMREANVARQLDPNSVDVLLDIAELCCRAERGEEALKLVGTTQGETRLQKARVKLVQGWAHRLAGNLDKAQGLLQEAATLNPSSARALFELGRVYRAKSQTDKAIDAYERALILVLDKNGG